jgi:hypothetical protein
VQLVNIVEFVTHGATVIARRRGWNDSNFIELVKLRSGKIEFRSPITGDKVEISTGSAVADDWDVIL